MTIKILDGSTEVKFESAKLTIGNYKVKLIDFMRMNYTKK